MKEQPFLNDDNFFKSMELTDEGLLKAKKLPIGTIRSFKGVKHQKVGERKWKLVKKENKKNEISKKDISIIIDYIDARHMNDIKKAKIAKNKLTNKFKNKFSKILTQEGDPDKSGYTNVRNKWAIKLQQ